MAGRNHATVIGIEDDQIRITANRDGPFLRKEAEELRGACARRVDKAMEVEFATADTVGVEQVDALLDARNTVGNLCECVFPEQLLRGIERAVVGCNRIDKSLR